MYIYIYHIIYLILSVCKKCQQCGTLGLHQTRRQKAGGCRSLRSQQSGSSSPIQTLAKPMLGDLLSFYYFLLNRFTSQNLAPKSLNWSNFKWDADAQDSCSSAPAMCGSIEVFCSLCQAFGSSEPGVHQWAEGAR